VKNDRNRWKDVLPWSGVVALVVMLILGVWVMAGPVEDPIARSSYSSAIYMEPGGAKQVVESGGEIEVQSGATLDVQSGATFDPTMTGATINGNLVVTGTSDVQGNVADSSGDLTIADNVAVTGTLDVQGGAITLQNDEMIGNATNGVVTIGGFLGLTEGTVVEATAAGTVTPLGSFQPLTSAAAITNAVIADGSLAGQIVILTNENGSDDITILESGSNLAAGGDITLAGGNDDAVMLLWTGDEWIKVAAFGDN